MKHYVQIFLALFILLPPLGVSGSDFQSRQLTLYPYQSTVEIQDDFILGTSTSGSIGSNGWSGAGTITVLASETNRPGIIRISTGAVSGTTAFISFNSTSVVPSQQHLITWIVRLNTIDANTTARIGSGNPVTSNPPTDGIYFEKLDGDTNWFCVTRAAGAQTRTDTGVAIAGTFTKTEYNRSTSNVEFRLNGVIACTHTTNIPTAAIAPFTQITNSAASAKTIDGDYFQMILTGFTR